MSTWAQARREVDSAGGRDLFRWGDYWIMVVALWAVLWKGSK